jgi:tripartite-type tricarboxylate transporter receptor subunit TctC
MEDAMQMISKLRMLAVAVVALALAGAAGAQSFPSKPIRLISPYAAGGANDIVCRVIAEKLSELMGQTVLVDNKPGAGSMVGSNILVKAPADGYTIMMADIAHGANPALRKMMPYDTLKDFAPVVLVAELPTVLLVNPSVPASSIAELVAYAKRNPGKLNYSSSGFGSTNHLAAEVFKDELGLDIVHVPYQGGGEAMNALLGGQVQMLFITLPASLPHIKAGKVRALALTGAKRMDSLPDVPTVAETVLPGFDINLWIGVVAPAGTPPAVIDRLNADFNKVLAMPAVKERITALGANIAGGTPAQFDAFIRKEVQRWAKTIKPEMRVD